MRKAFILSSCNTCQRILKEISWSDDIQNIKDKNIDAKTLDMIANKLGGYEALFSKRAMKYRTMGLNEMELSDKDLRAYILEEYTFLKRPVFLIDDQVFAGNSKKVVEAIKDALST